MRCLDCNNMISAIRLEAKPDTKYCIQCADKHTPVMVGRLIYPHKTAGELFITSGDENVRRLDREYKRAR